MVPGRHELVGLRYLPQPSFITDKIGDDSKVVGRDAGRAGGFIPALCSSKRAERQLWQRPCVRAESKLWRSRQFRRSRQMITFWVRRTRYGARMHGDRTAIEDQGAGKSIVIEWARSEATDAPPGAPEHPGRSNTSCR
jgi:hypothetical protein